VHRVRLEVERDRGGPRTRSGLVAAAPRQARKKGDQGKESAHDGEQYGRYAMNSPEVTEVQDRGPAAYIAEFVGTLLLVFFVTAVVSLYVTGPSAKNPAPFVDFSVIGLVHTFVLFGLIQTLAVVSGAHFNPAVTVVMTALRQIGVADAAIYIVSQLAGGVGGALLTKALLNDEGKGINYGATLVSSRLDGAIFPGMVVEAIGTFFLVWVIVGVAVNPRATKEWAALAIGAALGMAVMVLAPLTGAGFNPARSFGPAIVSGEWGGADHFLLVYVLAPVVGALVAGFLYFYLVLTPGKKGVGGVEPVG
jgi:MIP family channel proteins